MAFSYQRIINEAYRIANMAGGDANSSPVVDNKVVLEDLFYSALRQAIVEGSDKPAEIGDLKHDHTIAITNGAGTIPDNVLDEFLDSSSIYSDDGTLNGLMSFHPRYFDYIRAGHSQLGYYTVRDAQLLLKSPGGAMSSYNGNVHLVTTTMPTVADATTALSISTETAKRTVEILAGSLRGAK